MVEVLLLKFLGALRVHNLLGGGQEGVGKNLAADELEYKIAV
jgi:hypothetical protein